MFQDKDIQCPECHIKMNIEPSKLFAECPQCLRVEIIINGKLTVINKRISDEKINTNRDNK